MRSNKNKIEDLTLQKMSFSRDDINLYFVYKNETEYVEIKSLTARDAIALSGVTQPHMVVKVTNDSLNIVNQEMLKNDEENKEIPPENQEQS